MNTMARRRVHIRAGAVTATADLDDTPTAEAIWDALPLESTAKRWGDEVYFDIPVTLASSEDARDAMDMGELGYWPAGAAFCIFFGETPASRAGEPRAAGDVNPFGRLETDPLDFMRVETGDSVEVTALEE